RRHAAGVRSAGPALRAVGCAVRAAPVLPAVRGAVDRPGDLQPGAHRVLPDLRPAEQGTLACTAPPVGRARPVGRNNAGYRRLGPRGPAADVAAAPAAAAGAELPARGGAPG